MLYSKLYLQDKGFKVPVPLAVIMVLIISLGFGRLFLSTGTNDTRASKKTVKRVEVTNVSPYQANIYWQSEVKEDGYVLFGETLDTIKNIAIDDRDLPDKKDQYLNHYITLRNLRPGQIYFFKIVGNNQIIVKPDGTAFSFRTPQQSSSSSVLSPANGKVLNENLSGLDNGVVILYADGLYPLSVMTKSTGEWLIPLNGFIDKDKLESRVVSPDQKVKVEIFSEDNKTTVLTGQLSNFIPVSTTVIIGKSYELNDNGSNVLSAQSGQLSNNEIEVIYPIEGALIPGRKPLIKGTALSSAQIHITIDSAKTFSAVTAADIEGNWSYLLPQDLSLGNHTLIVKTKDRGGKDVIINRKFVIIANDNEGKVLGEASGSPTIVVTASPTPTVVEAPTAVITQPDSITPTALMNSGIVDILPVIGGMSFIVVGLGLLLVF